MFLALVDIAKRTELFPSARLLPKYSTRGRALSSQQPQHTLLERRVAKKRQEYAEVKVIAETDGISRTAKKKTGEQMTPLQAIPLVLPCREVEGTAVPKSCILTETSSLCTPGVVGVYNHGTGGR